MIQLTNPNSQKIAERYHWRISSPFQPGDKWSAGFTIHGTTGWNGRPDFRANADTPALTVCRAALLTTIPDGDKLTAD